ncbi:MAG: hypothetical protein KAI66_18265 [Lentisphaeria bacterium]|nr:hypothetical protein [Lentisphaeria bacterium]
MPATGSGGGRTGPTSGDQSNANIYHVSRMLGHESLETLQHYVRLNITDIQETHKRTHPRERDEKEERGE